MTNNNIEDSIHSLLGISINESNYNIVTVEDDTTLAFLTEERKLLGKIKSTITRYGLLIEEGANNSLVLPDLSSLNPIIDIFYDEGWDLLEHEREVDETVAYFNGPYMINWICEGFVGDRSGRLYVPVAYQFNNLNVRISTWRFDLEQSKQS